MPLGQAQILSIYSLDETMTVALSSIANTLPKKQLVLISEFIQFLLDSVTVLNTLTISPV